MLANVLEVGILGKITHALGPVGIVIGAVTASAVVAVKTLEKFANVIARLAGIASPGALRQWELALLDLQGVIGQRMVPVLELLTKGVRAFADILNAGWRTPAYIKQVGTDIERIFGGLAKGIKLVGETINSIPLLNKLIKWENPFGSSTGAAALPGRISTGEEYQKINIESALNSFAGQSIPQQQLSVQQQILQVLKGSGFNDDTDLPPA